MEKAGRYWKRACRPPPPSPLGEGNDAPANAGEENKGEKALAITAARISGLYNKVLLDDTDALTTPLIKRLLQSGVKHLSPIQREIIRCLYFQKIRAPKRHFRELYQMDGPTFDAALVDALRNLRTFFEGRGISGLHDIV